MEIKEQKNEYKRQNKVWNISSILFNIFVNSDHKDLVEFSTVCKKWNQLIIPIIHKNIKLIRNYGRIFSFDDKIDAEVMECISNNAKYAPFVKELNYIYKLESQRTIEVFQTFRFICNLNIGNCDMSQDEFLNVISPLTQLQELTLSNCSIKKVITERLYKEAAQLPSSLKKLRVWHIRLLDNPELFVQTINSHNNLIEFSDLSDYDSEFLKPFFKPYPSLINFEYKNQQLQNPQALIKVFEHNPQLISLKLDLTCWTSQLVSHMNSYLINLEELKLSKKEANSRDYTDFIVKFSQSTKIKRLNLKWDNLSNCSLNSILLNCPQLNELNIILSYKWKETIKSICEKCTNLVRLNIRPSYRVLELELDLLQEFYKTEFFTGNYKFNSTLTHLTLKMFKVTNSRAEYFNSFKSLKSIKYRNQFRAGISIFNGGAEVNMNLWPGYRLLVTNKIMCYDAELKKMLS
ncbi:RNI-like protein [Conidiobolus coronatus NRRL 28638]|uniref:RNI-like protein n=1 Tax=Conidiobolus coronatus (strain ATCC 28846 / CBS 209.66 / NRRL 28638) TaxID=796925 RepID=A0A137NTV7_CONC2|nr:RNI-like protein [Conidiobolus coronatus NRRL 28638]|eukprot:KXN66235.1 RNI-like protein [Conidiobolus coronatus NRRL 28638]